MKSNSWKVHKETYPQIVKLLKRDGAVSCCLFVQSRADEIDQLIGLSYTGPEGKNANE
jgi:hypothetical protein